MFSDERFYEQAWKSAPLTGMSVLPKNGVPERMIVLLHGYRGDARSNLGFARALARGVTNAAVIVPDGLAEVPEVGNPHVRQWWNLPPFEGRYYSFMPYLAPEEIKRGLDQIVKEAHVAAGILNKFLKKQAKALGLKLSDCFLCGISQGGITAFEMALFRSELHADSFGTRLGALAVIGAGIPGAQRIREGKTAIPPFPVLLARGTNDEIFPPSVDSFSESLLKEAGMPVSRVQVESGHFGLEHAAANDVCAFLNAAARN